MLPEELHPPEWMLLPLVEGCGGTMRIHRLTDRDFSTYAKMSLSSWSPGPSADFHYLHLQLGFIGSITIIQQGLIKSRYPSIEI